MRTYQPTYKDKKTGKYKKISKWWLELSDHNQIVRRFAGFTDRGQTEQLGRQIQRLINYKAAGEQLNPDCSRWLEQDCPRKLRQRLADVGLLDKKKVHAGKPLSEYMDEFKVSITSPKHARETARKIQRILLACKFQTWLDVCGTAVDGFVRSLNVTPRTKHHYIAAFRQFSKWMVREGYADRIPDIKSVKVPIRFERAFELDEFERLLEATFSEPVRYGLTGEQRGLLYWLAVETGLRRGELQTLRPTSFDFQNNTVFVSGENTKNGDDATQTISHELSARIEQYIKAKMPHAQLFNMPNKTAEMLRDDCRAAKLVIENNIGTFKFHNLRHSCGSFLAAKGVHPKVIQEILRHKDINLTMSRYTHTLRGQVAAAINKMPKFNVKRKAGAG